MNIANQHLGALCDLGYEEHEARFLYLVATHSGYFTIQQFTNFTLQPKGRPVHRFTQKLIQRRHARSTEYARRTYLFNVYSRRVYDPIDKENLRHRRRLSRELIHTRLLILDFVLAHLEQCYLETEADKVRYFHQELQVPLSLLPGRIYKGLRSNLNTKRYFIDRFPIFLPDSPNSLSLPPLPTFTYCQAAGRDLVGYISHLHNYEAFWRRLPAFNFVYAAPSAAHFERAAGFFARLFDDTDHVSDGRLLRYFELRRLWESKKYNSLTRADRDLLRTGNRRYQSDRFESAYRKWLIEGLEANKLDGLICPGQERQQRNFRTYVLPNEHHIFERMVA